MIKVYDTFELPVFMHPIPDVQAYVDSSFYFKIPDSTFHFEDSFHKYYDAFVEGGDPLPQWLSFSRYYGTFSGKPHEEASYNIIVKGRLPSVESLPDTFNISVVSNIDTLIFDHESLKCSVFPNPSSHEITITSDDYFDQIGIYSMSGSVIYLKDKLWNKEETINVDQLEHGFYLLIVRSKDVVYTERIIIL